MAKMNTMALLSFIFAFILSPLGVVFGIIALRQIKKTDENGKGFAIAGIVISLLYLIALTLLGLGIGFYQEIPANNFAVST